MKLFTFNGPEAGAEFSWWLHPATGPRQYRRHDTITEAEFDSGDAEFKRNVEQLVERGILTVGTEPAATPATGPEPQPAEAPGKE